MNVQEELVERCARRRAEKLGGLSAEAYDELVLAVRQNVDSFVDSPQEEAFAQLGAALAAYAKSVDGDDYLDDDQYFAARAKRQRKLTADCKAALATDPSCTDAQTMLAIVRAEEQDVAPDLREVVTQACPGGLGGWDDVFARPGLRAQAALVRACLAGLHLRDCPKEAEPLLEAMPADELGCRHTLAIAYARLEDEEAFDRLDARFGRQGSAWEHLGRVILMYKLGRMPAARRALRGYDNLVQGGAYALLRPILTEPYLPDRPEAPANSFSEAVMAVNEAEPTIADVPDLIAWCQGQDWFVRSGRSFADQSGFDWDD